MGWLAGVSRRETETLHIATSQYIICINRNRGLALPVSVGLLIESVWVLLAGASHSTVLSLVIIISLKLNGTIASCSDSSTAEPSRTEHPSSSALVASDFSAEVWLCCNEFLQSRSRFLFLSGMPQDHSEAPSLPPPAYGGGGAHEFEGPASTTL